ncbi:MAG: nickel pincer cofactor biosynthesis protein LarC [Desulfuromonadales bacterium]|nr:nickel pincer cofactor biosynthesis protein LarC [Desulfuromonadales bacterium]
MKTLYLDAFSGISGDMFLGLMFDLGVEKRAVCSALGKLDLDGYSLDVRREKRCGLAGAFVDITIDAAQPFRTWLEIDALIAASGLAEKDRTLARRIFRRLGEAEAKIHAVELESVHFHEVGAVDSILDIVGAAIALNRLGIDQVLCSPLPIGLGTVQTEHGVYPLPAPATLEVLRGCPTFPDASGLELVTPTGAVIAAVVATFAPLPAMTIETIGYGLGRRNRQDRPNVLRGIIGEVTTSGADADRVSVLETHLDDCNPEWLGALMEQLLHQGALDVAYAPLQMKKNRPGIRVTVISKIETAETLEKLLLRHSSAIGVRRYETSRRKLQRENKEVTTPFGPAMVKCLYDGQELIRVTPEFSSCHELAQRNSRPLPEIYRLVERSADTLFKNEEER